jgi:hypothetical protein
MDLGTINLEGVDWIELAYDTAQWYFVHTVINF